jgi:hypothetical protein
MNMWTNVFMVVIMARRPYGVKSAMTAHDGGITA